MADCVSWPGRPAWDRLVPGKPPSPQPRQTARMNAHIVLAHPEPKSFNGHLTRIAAERLERRGWSVTVSDLYAMGFDPCERGDHYAVRQAPDRFDAQAEQRHASEQEAMPPEVRSEIAKLDRCDLLILQYPMWWHLPPAMLKGWFDRVFIYGAVYASRKRFEAGRFLGKRAMLSVTVGTSPDTYAFNGRSGDIDLLLWPVNFTLAYVGFTVLTPFVAYGIEGGLRYSDQATIAARLSGVAEDYGAAVDGIDARASIPFHRMAEWGADGRIAATAPVHSPFIRHRRDLTLE